MNMAGDSAYWRQAQVAPDIKCLFCGYSLCGLGQNGACPECGEAVTATLSGNPLVFSEASWISSVRRGAGLVFAGLVAALVSLVASSILLGVTRRAAQPGLGSMIEEHLTWLPLLFGLYFLTLFSGIWLITARPAEGDETPRARVIRVLCRAGIGVYLLVWGLWLALMPSSGVPPPAAGLAAVSAVALWFGMIVLHIRLLGKRTFAPGLKWRSWLVAFVLAALWLIATTMIGAEGVLRFLHSSGLCPQPLSLSSSVMAKLESAGGCVVLVASVSAISLFRHFWKVLREVSQRAGQPTNQTWLHHGTHSSEVGEDGGLCD